LKIGVFTPLLSNFSLRDVLVRLKAQDIDTVELATGNYPGDAHCKLSMLEDKAELDEFCRTIADHGVTISALSCHGNPLHPDPDRSRHDQEVNEKTVLLAE
jgi:sugar phosphate isomerase/epimerase